MSCPINPPRKAKEITVRLGGYQFAPDKTKNIGMDNIWIKVQRPAQFLQTVKPMLNIGAMLQYVKSRDGTGGVILCNLNFQEHEAVPVNKTKKRTILATVLRNLKAPFAGRIVIAGANVDYTPIDIHTKATTTRTSAASSGIVATLSRACPRAASASPAWTMISRDADLARAPSVDARG